jgi:rsbT antagonist protein RsbS
MTEGMRIPIIRLYDNLIVSIQVALSDRLVIQLKDDITSAIERTRAQGLAIDLSGVDVMDSYLTRAIRDIAHIARMMGVRTVISGFDPLMVVNLIEMGLGLQGVHTELNLERAMEWLGAPRPGTATARRKEAGP